MILIISETFSLVPTYQWQNKMPSHVWKWVVVNLMLLYLDFSGIIIEFWLSMQMGRNVLNISRARVDFTTSVKF